MLYEALQLREECDVAIAREKMTWSLTEDVSSEVRPVFREQTQEELVAGMLGSRTNHYYCFMWNKLFRRRLIQDIRTHNYRFAEDWDYMLRAYFKAKKVVLLENDLYWWLQHPRSMSRKPDALFLQYQCKAQLFYDNLCSLPDSCAG